MTMRISSNYLSNILVTDLNQSLASMLNLQQQAASMTRILDYADDPRGVGSIQRYQTLIANNDQYLRNLTRSSVLIESTDTALQDLSTILSEARELVLRESSAMGTPDTHDTARTQVESLRNRLLDALNTTVEGAYLFSGNRTDTVPFVANGGTVIYQGNDEIMTAAVGPEASQDLNIPGSVFMGTVSSTLGGDQILTPMLEPTTPLGDINSGSGWTPGSIQITDAAGSSWTVDLSTAGNIDDVLTAINTTTGGAVTASIAADGEGLELVGTGSLEITEIAGGSTASDLGIRGVSDGGTFQGRDIRPAVYGATALADIPALAGDLPLAQLEVEVNGVITTVDFSAAVTMDDLKTAFEAALPGFEFRIDRGGVSVIGGSTDHFEIRNSGTPDTATLLGLEGVGSPVRMFGMLEDLDAALMANDTAAINDALVEIEQLERLVQSQLIKVGGRQQDVDWTESLLMQRDTQLQAKLSLERDADVAQVSADLAQAETSYQSSLLVTSKLFQSNLMMYL